MLTPLANPFRKRRGRSRRPAGPVLLAATFAYDDQAVLTLRFDRAVAIRGAFAGATLRVNDPQSGGSYAGTATPPTPLDPATLQIVMTPAGASSGTRTLLTAAAGSGIVAAAGAAAGAADGAGWAGCADVELPLGE